MKLGHWLLMIGAVGTLALLIYELTYSHHPMPSSQPQAITGCF